MWFARLTCCAIYGLLAVSIGFLIGADSRFRSLSGSPILSSGSTLGSARLRHAITTRWRARDMKTVYCDIPGCKIGKILSKRGWIVTTDSSVARFLWYQQKSRIKWSKLKPWQIVNHIPKERELSHKGKLLDNLHLKYGPAGAEYMPASYALWDPKQVHAFIGASGMFTHPWILKEPYKDNGAGITLVTSQAQLDQIRYNLTNADADSKLLRKQIIQKYVTNPLLWRGHKFDLRMYWIVASTDPLVVFFYNGYMRVSITQFNGNDFSDLGTHLTNARVQKTHEAQYKMQKEMSRRPFSTLEQLVTEHFSSVPGAAEKLRCSMHRAIREIIDATRTRVFDQAVGHNRFVLFGADFMVDDRMHIWLSEVQSGPGLPSSTQTTKQFFAELLPGLVELELEVMELQSRGAPLWPLRGATERFELLLHEGGSDAELRANDEHAMSTCRRQGVAGASITS